MRDYVQFYIDGAWVAPAGDRRLDVINPATEAVAGRIALGDETDVDRAVKAAQRAFESFGQTSREDRLKLLDAVIAEYKKRMPDLAAAITEEMGAPTWLAEQMQVPLGLVHLENARKVLETFEFDHSIGSSHVVKEPVGVCAFITPWNWPINQISCKVAPALATGCTMVLKPSEVAPFSGQIYAEVMHAAGVPAGVFNLVHGDGPGVGAALSAHPGVDMVSFTGSTRAGIEVARAAAPTIKRVHQELGGKSPNILLDGIDIGAAVTAGVENMMLNAGQSCNAPTRMLVPAKRMDEAKNAAKAAAEAYSVGAPDSNARMGPVVSQVQWTKIQDLIQAGIDEGATLVAGGTGRPEGLDKGYYVRPTVFADVTNDMRIAREEIFGPVLAILGYEDEEDAISIANDTPYGLAAYLSGPEPAQLRRVMQRLRAGQVFLNGAGLDFAAPFGGYKQSGNGREWGAYAFHDFLETKAVMGFEAAAE
nr:aldehyde dehydrogenase family protein [Sphingomonas sp. Y57]